MNEGEDMADRSLVRARWVAVAAGFLIAGAVLVLSLFACSAASIVGLRMHALLYGKPLPALTEWVVDSAEYLIGGREKAPHLIWLAGVFLLVYSPLLIAVRRAGSVGSVSLTFAVWLGLVFSVEWLAIGFMAVCLLLPFVTLTVSLRG